MGLAKSYNERGENKFLVSCLFLLFANWLFDFRRVVGGSKPALDASVGHAVAVVGNVEKPLGAAMLYSVTLERFVLREALTK